MRKGAERWSGADAALGIDIGGTKMALAVVERGGRVLATDQIPTEAARGFARAVDRLVETARKLARRAGVDFSELAGAGIGCTGPLDTARGTINNPWTLEGWSDCDIVSPLRSALGVAVRLENDADAAALGEWAAGAGRGSRRLVMLTFGTGIGGGIIIDGRIYRGAAGEHPELGHLHADPEGPACYCGTRGCLESVAAGPAIAAAARAIGLADGKEAFTRAAAGDAGAAAVIGRAARATATAVWEIVHAFLPDRILFGGGMMDEHFDAFAPEARARIAAATMFPRARVTIEKASLGSAAGVVGAAFLAWSEPDDAPVPPESP
jgi:glucokinase